MNEFTQFFDCGTCSSEQSRDSYIARNLDEQPIPYLTTVPQINTQTDTASVSSAPNILPITSPVTLPPPALRRYLGPRLQLWISYNLSIIRHSLP
jgi:hypothetical protein